MANIINWLFNVVNNVGLEIIINSVIALMAIIAVGISIYTTHKNNYAKRAFIAPTTEAGFFNPNEETQLQIDLLNYGNNPARNITSDIYGFIRKSDNNIDLKLDQVFKISNESINPIPKNAYLYIRNSFDDSSIIDLDFKLVYYIYMRLEYFDEELKRTFSDKFYWELDYNGKFFEIGKKDKDMIDAQKLL